MIYVDTSVLVSLIVNESASPAVARWYEGTRSELVAAGWCVTEFASALSLKRRTGQLDSAQAAWAWEQFERLCAHDLKLGPVEPADFHRASQMILAPAGSLRAGDALHLACAKRFGARTLATLDEVMERHARGLGMKVVNWSVYRKGDP